MGRIYKRNQVWYIDVWANGKRIRRRVGKSKKIAELALHDAEVKIAKDELGFDRKDISINELIDRFLEYNRTNHRPSTTRRYKSVTDHLKEFLVKKRPDITRVSQITPEILESYKAFRRDSWVNPNGRPVRDLNKISEHTRLGARSRTVNLELEGIRAMLNIAIRWGYLKNNPVKLVKLMKPDDIKPERWLTVEEIDKLLNNTPAHLYPIYFTFLNTGMRKSELENLQWKDVDFKRKRILIRPKKDWRPKTKDREIPMNDDVVDVLDRLKRQSIQNSEEDYVFPIKSEGHSHNWLRNQLIKIAHEAGINDLTKIHTLRHTFASHLVMQGVDFPTVSRLLGHSDLETTMLYAHLAPEHLSDAIRKLPYKRSR